MQNFTSIIFVHWGMNEERSELSKKSLSSLLASLQSPCEVIVVDNGGELSDSTFFLNECHEKRISQYIRNSDNFHFAYARNQAMKLAKGDYIVIMDNDLIYTKGWLEECIELLEAFPDRKFVATPMRYPNAQGSNKQVHRYDAGEVKYKDKSYYLNMRAGSNCFVMRKETMKEIGYFIRHIIAGSYYVNKLVREGYVSIVNENIEVKDVGLRQGYNLKKEYDFKKTLSDGSQIKL